IIPIITALIIASAVYVVRHSGQRYTGEALIYTGSVNSTDLTDPTNIAAKYSDANYPAAKYPDLKNLVVFVSEKGQVKFTLNGKTQGEVQKELDTITKDYNKQLQMNSADRVKLTKQSLNILNNRSKILEKLIPSYNDTLDHGNLLDDQKRDLTMLSLDAQVEKTKVDEKIISMSTDLKLFEQPNVVLKPTVSPKKTYIPQGLIIGIILGLVFTVAFLMLLKYISDARRYYKHD
ncbi:MAG: hypothetical protein Q8898_17855, partial [Bacillota bacterium]|nr:hypothetical protein [Bacillota bacterium]